MRSSRLLARLEELETALLPKPRIFVVRRETDDPDYETRIETFKLEHDVKPSDCLLIVSLVTETVV